MTSIRSSDGRIELSFYPVFALIVVALMGGASAQDKKLFINDQVECNLQSATIQFNGDLSVVVQDFEECIGSSGGGLALSPLVPTATSVDPGQSLNIWWISTSTTFCDAIGNLPGWPSANIGTQGPTTVFVPSGAAPGNYTATVRCPAGSIDGLTESTGITVNSAAVEPPPAPSLSVSPSTVEQGGSVGVSWSSTSADECFVPSGGTNPLPGWSGGSLATSGSQDVAIGGSLTPGQYSLRLQCRNVGGESPITQRTLTVQEPTPSQCGPDRQPPPGKTRATQCSQVGNPDCRSYEDFFGGFPGTTSIRFFVLSPNQYAAMAFTQASVPAAAKANLNIEPLQTGGVPAGQLRWSMSTCPGDFNESAIEEEFGGEGCYREGIDAGFGFNFGGSSWTSSSSRCGLNLAPGTTYYLNIEFVDPTCDSTSCGYQIQPTALSGWPQ